MSDRPSKPDVAELQHTAQAAREALTSSLARLDDRVKQLRNTAAEATAASGWGIAAVAAWWLSFAIDRPRPTHVHGRIARPPLASVIFTTALKTASVVLTGALVYASYRHARRLAAPSTDTVVGQLTSGDAPVVPPSMPVGMPIEAE
jgi:hypothetical protein